MGIIIKNYVIRLSDCWVENLRFIREVNFIYMCMKKPCMPKFIQNPAAKSNKNRILNFTSK